MSELDRVISIRIEGEPTRDRYNRAAAPSSVTTVTVWARRTDVTLETAHAEARSVRRRNWRIRYRPDVANTPAARLWVTDEGTTFSVANLVEVDRRRWIDIQGEYST